MRFAFFQLISLCMLTGCAHYRSHLSDFRAGGAYRRPSDYSPETMPPVNPTAAYAPQRPFQLRWPVERVRVTQTFKNHPRHEGIDLGGGRGVPILAAHEGRVVYTGQDFNGYGKMVILEYDNQWATLYGHLDKISVREGSVVQPGQSLGTMGRTGRATGVHLHFEVMRHRLPIDPLPLL